MSDFPTNSKKSLDSAEALILFGASSPTREQVANFLFAHAPMLRRRIRGKLAAKRRRSENTMLAAIDEDDIFSTLCRRMDKAALELKFETLSEPQFWAYIHTITENAILERLRDGHPPLPLPEPDDPANPTCEPSCIAQCQSSSAQHHAAASLADCIAIAPTLADRHLIELKAKGIPYAAISAATGRSRDALRTQWCMLARFLRASAPPPNPQPPLQHHAPALTTGGLRRSALITTPSLPPPTRTHARTRPCGTLPSGGNQ